MQWNRRGILSALLCSPVIISGLRRGTSEVELPDDFVLSVRHKGKEISVTADEIMAALQPIKSEPIHGRLPSTSTPFIDFVPNSVAP